MTVAELRKIAEGIDSEELKGHSTMHKEKLLPLLCKVLNIEMHVQHHKVTGIDKSAVKLQIRTLKKERDKAMQDKNYQKLKEIRRNIHDLKIKLRRVLK